MSRMVQQMKQLLAENTDLKMATAEAYAAISGF
jgi:hypothetical protein